VNGAKSTGVPATLARQLIAADVIAVHLPHSGRRTPPNNLLPVVSCCFQILESGCDNSLRGKADLVIAPKVGGLEWNALGRGPEMIEASEAAALDCLAEIQEWLAARSAAATHCFKLMWSF